MNCVIPLKFYQNRLATPCGKLRCASVSWENVLGYSSRKYIVLFHLNFIKNRLATPCGKLRCFRESWENVLGSRLSRVRFGAGAGFRDFLPDCHFWTKSGSGAEPECNFAFSEICLVASFWFFRQVCYLVTAISQYQSAARTSDPAGVVLCDVSESVGVESCSTVLELDWSCSKFKNYRIGVVVKN